MKRLVSLLLCIIMVFGSFSAVMAAEEPEAAPVVDNADLIAMKTIGVFDSSTFTGVPMTRRQLANVYFKILLPEQADDEYIATKFYFDDILESDFAINIVHEAGIMSGMGDNKFMPDAQVSYIQVVKTLIDFLGYREQAEAYGGYPYGYAIMASTFGLSQYAPDDINMICTADMAAVLFRKALDIKVNSRIYADNPSIREYEKIDENYLELYTKIYMDQGIVTSTYVEDTYQYVESGFFDIRIDNKPVILSDEVIEMNELLGYNVTYFYKLDKHDNKIVLHYEIVDTEVIDIDPATMDCEKTDTNYIYYYNENNKLKKFDISDAYIFYNGELCRTYNAATINPFDSSDIDGHIRVVSTDGNIKTAEYVFIEAFNSYIVKTIQGNDILNRYHPEIIFDVNDITSGEIVMKNVLGEVIDPTTLAIGDIMNVYSSPAGEVKKVIITLDTHLGTIEGFKRLDGKVTHMTVDGIVFPVAKNFYLNPEIGDLKIGIRAKVYFNMEGKISDITLADYDETKFGFIIKADTFRPLEKVHAIQMLTSKNTIEALELKDEVVFNGEERSAEYVLTALGSPVQRQICRYTLNSRNLIDSLELVNPSCTPEQDGFYQLPNITVNWWRGNTFGGKIVFKSSMPIFVVPNEENKDNMELYMATDTSFFVDGSQPDATNFMANFIPYGTKANNPAADAAVYTVTSLGATETIGRTPCIVTSTSIELVDDEIKYIVNAFSSGTAMQYEFKEEAFYCGVDGAPLEIGDAVVIGRNKQGLVTRAKMVFDASEWKQVGDYSANPYGTVTSNDHYLTGTIDYLDDFAITYAITLASGDIQKESFMAASGTVYEYSAEGRGEPTLVKADTTALRDRYNNNAPSKVFVYVANGTPSVRIICND